MLRSFASRIFIFMSAAAEKKIESAYEKSNDQLHPLYMHLRLCLERRLGLPLQPKLPFCEHGGREERV